VLNPAAQKARLIAEGFDLPRKLQSSKISSIFGYI
jgi:hypothetical protein